MLKIKNIASRRVCLVSRRRQTRTRHIFWPNRSEYQAGFVPMLVMIIIVLGAVLWFGYRHVSDVHKKQLEQKTSQVENSLSQ